MSAVETAPSSTHPAWCWPTDCVAENGVTFHRGCFELAGDVAVDIAQVGDGPVEVDVHGLVGLSVVDLAARLADLLHVTATLTAGSIGRPTR